MESVRCDDNVVFAPDVRGTGKDIGSETSVIGADDVIGESRVMDSYKRVIANRMICLMTQFDEY